jgi:hypothetical protein
VGTTDPFPVIENALMRTAANSEAKPNSATRRARVDEKSEMPRMIDNGLKTAKGSDPGPPGFPRIAKFGPPPGIKKPASIRNLLGFNINSKLHGAQSSSGVRTKAIRR